VVQDVAKKRRRKGSNPREKIRAPQNPVVPRKNTFLAGSPTFCFSFYYNCVDMIKQPPGITCCLLLVRKFKRKSLKIGVNKKKSMKLL